MSIKAEVARLRAMVPDPAWTDPGFIVVVAVRQLLHEASEGDRPYPGPFHPDGRPITLRDVRAHHDRCGLPPPDALVDFLDIARTDDDAP